MGDGSPFHEVAFQPNQGPSLAAVTVSGSNRKRNFSASGASDTDGSVTGYRWEFGDGATALTDAPTTKHTYAKSGNYQVRVSAVDNEGCGPSDIFDGRVFLCNAASGASAPVDARAPSLSKLRFTKRSVILRRSSTKLSYKLSEKATVKLQFQVRKGKKYVTKKTLTFSSKSGTRKRSFNGKIKSRYLKRGKYRVLVSATDKAKNTSKAKKLTLTIR